MSLGNRATVASDPQSEINIHSDLSPSLHKACHDTMCKVSGTQHHPSADELGEILAGMQCDPEDFVPHVRYDLACYCRTPIASSFRADLILIGWVPGQFSPPHDHGGGEQNRCAVRVISGIGQEHRFELDRNKELVPIGTSTVSAGDIVLNRGPDIHELGCSESATEPFVTLHLYTPPLPIDAMCIFDCPEN